MGKSHDMAYGRVTKGDTSVVDYDEFVHVLKVRYMTANEAYMRPQSYPILKLSHVV